MGNDNSNVARKGTWSLEQMAGGIISALHDFSRILQAPLSADGERTKSAAVCARMSVLRRIRHEVEFMRVSYSKLRTEGFDLMRRSGNAEMILWVSILLQVVTCIIYLVFDKRELLKPEYLVLLLFQGLLILFATLTLNKAGAQAEKHFAHKELFVEPPYGYDGDAKARAEYLELTKLAHLLFPEVLPEEAIRSLLTPWEREQGRAEKALVKIASDHLRAVERRDDEAARGFDKDFKGALALLQKYGLVPSEQALVPHYYGQARANLESSLTSSYREVTESDEKVCP